VKSTSVDLADRRRLRALNDADEETTAEAVRLKEAALFDFGVGNSVIGSWLYTKCHHHIPTTAVETAAVTATGDGVCSLLFNPEFFVDIGLDGVKFVLFHEARHLIRALLHRFEGIGHDLGKRIGHVERGIGADVLPRIRGLEREIHGEIVRERLRARAAERTAEREITNLWKWTRTHMIQAGTLAFAGAVALALSRLGLGWLRCNSLSRLGKRIGCGGFAALEDLLFGAVTALAVTDICEFANVAMGTAELIRPALLELVDVEDALVGCHGATGAPPLEPSRLRLPTNTRNLPLAA